MDDLSIQAIISELEPLLIGRSPGKIFQLGPASLAIDFGLRDLGYLFISVEPAEPRLYLIKRKVRDLEKQSISPTPFALALRKELSGTQIVSFAKDADDRIVRLGFAGQDDLGKRKQRYLLAHLTGRSASLLLLNGEQTVIQRARPTDTPGQQIGDSYLKPATNNALRATPRESKLLKQIRGQQFSSPSEAADAYFIALIEERSFATQAGIARADLGKKIAQQQKLQEQLQKDLESHANAESEKRMGDILLANLSTAKRRGNHVTLIDYFSSDAATIEIELDASSSLQEEAARRFALYSRSKRAVAQINSRIELGRKRLEKLLSEQESLEKRISEPAAATGALSAPRSVPPAVAGGLSTSSSQPKTKRDRVPGTRRYLSADGFEILVGRTAQDNDHLTFKIAKPNDTWLHAGDYGGSHVVVRNSSRKPIPQRTLIEAAQLTAWFSQAKKDPKVDVHYTERKFVSKIKGGKPGLVRLQRFKNITVSPKEAGTKETI
ncbi:MAG: NFACT RNA binding domain-containing protein [Pyrinomonadaceae bacterium]